MVSVSADLQASSSASRSKDHGIGNVDSKLSRTRASVLQPSLTSLDTPVLYQNQQQQQHALKKGGPTLQEENRTEGFSSVIATPESNSSSDPMTPVNNTSSPRFEELKNMFLLKDRTEQQSVSTASPSTASSSTSSTSPDSKVVGAGYRRVFRKSESKAGEVRSSTTPSAMRDPNIGTDLVGALKTGKRRDSYPYDEESHRVTFIDGSKVTSFADGPLIMVCEDIAKGDELNGATGMVTINETEYIETEIINSDTSLTLASMNGQLQQHRLDNNSVARVPCSQTSDNHARQLHATSKRSSTDLADYKTIARLIRNNLWSVEPSVVEESLLQLTNDASRSEYNRDVIVRAGGILAIIRAMEQHADDAPVQIAACRLLEKIALNDDNELAIADVGGVDAILGAMMSHFANEQVQEAAWSAMWNLTCRNASQKMTVDTSGGMEAIISCMKHHERQPVIQKNAVGALANLCMDHDHRMDALVAADGFVAIASTLQTHWNDLDVRREASQALSLLLYQYTIPYSLP